MLALLQSRGGGTWTPLVAACAQNDVVGAHDKIEVMPDPVLEPQCWEHLWSLSPGGWAALLRHLRDVVCRHPGYARDVLRSIPELLFLEDVCDCSEEEDDEVMCGQFGRTFGTVVACRLHAGKVLGGSFASRLRAVAATPVCPCCGADFRSRPRLVHHLAKLGCGRLAAAASGGGDRGG